MSIDLHDDEVKEAPVPQPTVRDAEEEDRKKLNASDAPRKRLAESAKGESEDAGEAPKDKRLDEVKPNISKETDSSPKEHERLKPMTGQETAEQTKAEPGKANETGRPELKKYDPEQGQPEPVGICTNPDYLDGDGNIKWPNRQWHGCESPDEPMTLKKGQTVERVGPPEGYYLTEPGTPLEKLSLPYDNKEDLHRHRYVVDKDFDTMTGKTAAAFDQPGGGTQFHTGKMSIRDLIEGGYLKEVGDDESY